MIKMALLIARKDLKLMLARGSFIQAPLLGLLVIFVFSLSKGLGEVTSARDAAAIFWISSIFCQILIFNQLYGLEEENEVRTSLILARGPAQGIWLGKTLAALILLLLAQAIFLPATVIFLGRDLDLARLSHLAVPITVDFGICALGSLLGAVGHGRGGRDAILAILMFPLLIPLLLAGITLGADVLESGQDIGATLGMALAFDAIFSAAGLALFGFLYQGDD